MSDGARKAYGVLVILLIAGVVLQFFLAGLAMFGASSFAAHETAGSILHGIPVLMIIAALAGRFGGRAVFANVALLALVTVQMGLPELRDDAAGIAALHPLVALLILGFAFHLLRYATPRAAAPAAA